MNRKLLLLVILASFIISFPVFAEIKINKIHPDEPVQTTLDKRFSLQNSLICLKNIEGALSSFKKLTEKSRLKLGKTETAKVGNTDWEIQNLGFSNWQGAIEGCIRKQDYEIKQLQYELAEEKYRDGLISKEELKKSNQALKKAEQEFTKFWNSTKIAD